MIRASADALSVALADGVMEDHERIALIGISDRLELGEDMVSAIVKVVAIMQRPETA